MLSFLHMARIVSRTIFSKLRMIKHIAIITVFVCVFMTPSQTMKAQVLLPQPISELSAIDIIVEGDTYVPYFYAGRAEPSAGNSVRLIALMSSPGGQPATYRWKVGSIYISTVGPVLRTKMSQLEERTIIEVTALNSDGLPIGKGSEYVSVSTPRLLFYEDNALRGTSQVAIQEGIILIGNETAVKAEPYFAGVSAVGALNASWSSNLVLEQAEGDWRLVYLKSPTEEGGFNGEVLLKVSNPQNLNEYLSATFNVSL